MPTSPKSATKPHKFKVQLLGQEGYDIAALKPPFDVVDRIVKKGLRTAWLKPCPDTNTRKL
jgi:hypothetical protein